MEAHAARAHAWAEPQTALPVAVPLSAIPASAGAAEARPRITGNALLNSLPDAERLWLEPLLRRAVLATRQVLVEPRRDIATVFFPVSGVISLVTVMSDGTSVHVASVGTEGLAGIPVFFGATSTPNLRAVAQMPGLALTMPASQFHGCMERSPALERAVAGYAHALLTQAAQEVACNRRHSVLERCSCWLLVTADRTRTSEFPMTQEFLAELLGTRRASVVAAAGALQRAGAISYRRGRIRIVDRIGLEGLTCGCYPVIRQTLHTAAA